MTEQKFLITVPNSETLGPGVFRNWLEVNLEKYLFLNDITIEEIEEIEESPFPTPTPRPTKFMVYTDGSAKATEPRAGAFCSVVVADTGEKFYHSEAMSPTTIGQMEILGVCSGLRSILNRMDQCKTGYSVQVFCDSTYVVNCATGAMKRTKNKEMWNIFDKLAQGMDITISHTPRNTIPEQAECDEIAGKKREELEAKLNGI